GPGGRGRRGRRRRDPGPATGAPRPAGGRRRAGPAVVRLPGPHRRRRAPAGPLRLPDGRPRGDIMDLTRPLGARTRSITAENPTGAPGQGGRIEMGSHSTAYASRELPLGWKKSPCIDLKGNETRVLAEIEGPGVIQHI